MQQRLINLSIVHTINRVHPNIQNDVVEGQSVDTLRELISKQVRRQEERVNKELLKLMEMYQSVMEDAVAARPNVQLSAILSNEGISFTDDQQ